MRKKRVRTILITMPNRLHKTFVRFLHVYLLKKLTLRICSMPLHYCSSCREIFGPRTDHSDISSQLYFLKGSYREQVFRADSDLGVLRQMFHIKVCCRDARIQMQHWSSRSLRVPRNQRFCQPSSASYINTAPDSVQHSPLYVQPPTMTRTRMRMNRRRV